MGAKVPNALPSPKMVEQQFKKIVGNAPMVITLAEDEYEKIWPHFELREVKKYSGDVERFVSLENGKMKLLFKNPEWFYYWIDTAVHTKDKPVVDLAFALLRQLKLH